MGARLKRALLVVLCLALPVSAAGFPHASAQDGVAWLGKDTPTLTKITELPHHTSPTDNDVSCSAYTYLSSSQQPTKVCTFDSPLGTLTQDGSIQTGPDTFVTLNGPVQADYFIPSPNPAIAVLSMPKVNGSAIGIYKNLSKADLVYNQPYLGAPYYSIDKSPDSTIKNPVTRATLSINPNSVAFSANGRWMVAHMPYVGLVRVDMTDLSVQMFAGVIEPGGYSGSSYVAMAVSNDGRYVAANTDVYGNDALRMYDLSTCTDQLNATHPKYCNVKDLWNDGLAAAYPGTRLHLPSHLQFTAEDSLSFYARYNVVSNSNYQVADFIATAPGSALHTLGLLGMGDSYISGQGAYVYHSNSDTSVDQCHVSEFAYPFLLGREFFGSYNSIACSGATTRNISSQVDSKQTPKTYTGQVKDNIEEQKRTATDLDNIFANFLPGYVYQQEFAAKYKPEAILLSVGGDDIGFSDIVKQCVSPFNRETCYNTYEDRAELVNEVDGTYNKLVQTYKTIREQSGGARLYVVGYPQVAQVGGNCGDNVLLNADEVTFAAQLVSYLDGVIEQAAGAAGAFYVDAQQAFYGHELCQAGTPAMNGLTIKDLISKSPVAPESYHPTQLGYQLLADTIAGATADLTAPMPTPTDPSVPVFDPTLPFLASVPTTGRPIRWVTHDDSIAGDVMLRGDTQQVTVDGDEVQLKPGSDYQIVLHSTPVTLAEGMTDADGNVAALVQIPADIDPGYHVLHVYGTDMAGNRVDIQKTVYISDGSEPPVDAGTGTPNSTTSKTDDIATDGTPSAAGNHTVVQLSATTGSAEDQTAAVQSTADGATITGDNSASGQLAQNGGTVAVLGDTTRTIQPDAHSNTTSKNAGQRHGHSLMPLLAAAGVCAVLSVALLRYGRLRR